MKNILFILIFLIFRNGLIAQEIPFSQEQWFKSGQKYLKKGKLEVAVSQFYMANKYGKNSDIQILARQKIDSLLPLIHKKIIKQWKGNWKMKELNYNPYPGTFSDHIRFEDDKIVFFKKDSDGKEIIIRSELIKFLPYDSFNIRNVAFKNSEIWSFGVGKKNSQKRLYPKLVRDSSGIRKILLDERGIIIDRKLRKRELKKEIYTFYVKAE
ncbi:hypothetical protein [Flavobacterium sp. 11]|jgi:hypothetical protein|uniref:hypothetical protein n=1 Tax=Flavobacterium sp. 11 TaxID=357523 RepID=UPI000C18CB3C|nr:hypothetical protein [Flavobacterium sp. 11]PIF62442.1 hypothetical protein CLV00_2081 [Flavobacterium sp. 11]